MTSIIPKRNVFLPGVKPDATTLRRRDAGRRIGSPDGQTGLIMGQVISWPWGSDELGIAFPGGIVGIRTTSPGRATEISDDAAGTDEGWIAVPADTLPVGYTARRQRDHNRGPLGVTRRRGNAYLVCAPVNPTNDQASFYFDPYFSINGLDPATLPTSLSPLVPSYRTTDGGSTVKVPWLPMNVSQKTLNARSFVGPVSTDDPVHSYIDPLPIGPSAALTGGAAYLAPHVGWRNIRIRFGLTDFTSSTPVVGTYYVRAIISHMADGSNTFAGTSTGLGDTIDYDTGWAGHTAFAGTTNPTSRVFNIDLDIGAVLPTGKTTSWFQAAFFQMPVANGLLMIGRNAFVLGSSGPFIQYATGVFGSPRVDVPAWFTATGAGLLAPGGV